MKITFRFLAALILLAGTARPQVVFEQFETHPDCTYAAAYAGSGDSSRLVLTLDTATVFEGRSALRCDWQVARDQLWGGLARYEMWHRAATTAWDFSAFETLHLQYFNDVPSSDSGRVQLRILLYDVSHAPPGSRDPGQCEVWYAFAYVLDDPPGWNRITLPLENVGPDAVQGQNGFWRSGWAGITGNDQLDLDRIGGIAVEIAIDGPDRHDVHRGSLVLDYLTFAGGPAPPLVLFNGMAVPVGVTLSAWNGQARVEAGAGHTPATNALRWIQDPNQAWSGIRFDFPARDMTVRWPADTLRFWLKAPTGTGTLRVQFADSAGNAVKERLEEPTGGYGGNWVSMGIALRDIDTFESGNAFDTSVVARVEIMAEGSGNGYTIDLDDMWTGRPLTEPGFPPPGEVLVVPDSLANLIVWTDAPVEYSGETYNLYYSASPIDNVHAPGVEMVDMGMGRPENSGIWPHLLFAPVDSATVRWHYAVTAVDTAGNESLPALCPAPVSNVARGIATLSTAAPPGFAADGNTGEWDAIRPFRLFPSEGAHVAANTVVDGDGDLSAQFWLAGDADHFYFAVAVSDDVLDTSGVHPYDRDSPSLHLGLYDHHGAPHRDYARGAEPDYHLRFLPDGVRIANLGGVTILTWDSGDYFWGVLSSDGYVVEGRVPWSAIAAPGGDALFVPRAGMRLPLDVAILDADGGGVREGMLTWSPYNDDTAWRSPEFWLYSWVTAPAVVIAGPPPRMSRFDLFPNYPNPFNPTTTIRYVLPRASTVTLTVFDVAGRKVATLANGRYTAGRHVVRFDGRGLASGIYYYRIEAGGFRQTRKMVLLK